MVTVTEMLNLKRKYRITWLGNCGSWTINDRSWECYAYSKRDAHRKFLEHLGPKPRNQYTDDSILDSFSAMKADIVRVDGKEIESEEKELIVELCDLHKQKPSEVYDFYIDRKTPIGNPYTLTNEAYRDVVCNGYQNYFEIQVFLGDSDFMSVS